MSKIWLFMGISRNKVAGSRVAGSGWRVAGGGWQVAGGRWLRTNSRSFCRSSGHPLIPSPCHPLIPSSCLPASLLPCLPPAPSRLHLFFFILLSFLLASCSFPVSVIDSALLPRSTRPVVKIGLIGPFEGLYRRAGYEGLAAARMAVADQAGVIEAAGVDVLIQALDDSARVAGANRAREKLLVDPAVGAVVGPLAPWIWLRQAQPTGNGQAQPTGNGEVRPRVWTSDRFEHSERGSGTGPFFGVPWAEPALWGGAVAGRGALDPFSQSKLILAVADLMVMDAAETRDSLTLERLLVGGLADVQLPEGAAIVLGKLGNANAVMAGDVVLWLGSPADGAALVNDLRARDFDGPVWFGPWGGDPILYERLQSVDDVFWAIWQDSHYTDWAESHNLWSPYAYLVYRMTEKVIWHLLDLEDAQLGDDWTVAFYGLGDDGVSRRLIE